MNRKELRIVFLAMGFLLILLCANTAQAQILPRLFNNNSKPTPPKISPEVSQAFRPSESDLEAAKNARNSLIDPEWAENRTNSEPVGIPYFKILQEKSQNIDDSVPQVVVETRFIECTSQMIAPKGMLPEHGWVLLPIAQKQKGPAVLRVENIVGAEGTNLAAGALSVTEQYTPTLFRFIDTEEFGTVRKHLIGDRQSHYLQTPKMTIVSGQSGQMYDITDECYTWTNSKNEPPEMEIIPDGICLNVRAEVTEDGSVKMTEFLATMTQLIGQEQYSLDPDNEIVLSIPKMYTQKFNLPITIPAGKTLLVAVPFANRLSEEPRNKSKATMPNTLCLAVTCQVISPEQVAENEQKNAAEESTRIAQILSDANQAEREWIQFMMNDNRMPLTR